MPEHSIRDDFSYLKNFSARGFFDFLKKNRFLAAIVALSIMIMYGVKLISCSYGVDSDLYLEYKKYLEWISIGRFGLVLLQKICIAGEVFNPFSAIFFSLIFLFVGTLLFTYLTNVFSRKLDSFVAKLVFALTFVSGAVWCEQLYFTVQAAECIFIMILVPVAVWLIFNGFVFNRKCHLIAGAFLVFFMASVYQGVLALLMGTILACFILHCDETRCSCSRGYIILCLKILALVFGSVALYFIVNKIVTALDSSRGMAYLTDSFKISSPVQLAIYLYTLTLGNIDCINSLVGPVIASHAQSGNSAFENIVESSTYANWLLIPSVLAFVLEALRNSRRNPLYVCSVFGFLLCIIIFPIVSGGSVPDRVQYIVPFASAFVFVYFLGFISRRKLWVCTCAVLLVENFFYIQRISSIVYSDKIRFDNDKRTAMLVYERIAEFTEDNGLSRNIPIYISGKVNVSRTSNYICGGDPGNGTQGSFSYGGKRMDNTCSIISFIRSLGYDLHNDAYSMPDGKEPDVSDLTSFPGKNCLKLVDNEYILMKLSD